MQKKRLVVCFDGTWNNADRGGSETNVSILARSVQANSGGDGVPQLTLYLRGVGSTGNAIRRLLDGATGDGLDDNILSAYMFLAQNYVPAEDGRGADEIFLFGFSRGAFTARSLCGMIGACGLLKRQDLDRIADAWSFYRNERAATRRPEVFRQKHEVEAHRDVAISFLGVWDTVGSLGIPSSLIGSFVNDGYEFHDTTPSRIVRRARHALATDEHRDEFIPTFWTHPAPDGADIGQVWFAGVHSDVGGGYANRTLADIPLLWMADEAREAGLKLDADVLPRPGDLDCLAPQHESRKGYSSKDYFTPTFRRILEHDVDAAFNEAVYVPRDRRRKVLATINESIHPSLKLRFGRPVRTLSAENKVVRDAVYHPKNLAPALDAEG